MKFLVLAAVCVVLGSAIGNASSYSNKYGILDAFRGNLHRNLDQADNLIVRRKDLQAVFSQKIVDLRVEIDSTEQMTGGQANSALANIKIKINSLSRQLTEALKTPPPKKQNVHYSSYNAGNELGEIFGKIKHIVLTDEGLAEMKNYATSLVTSHPVVFLMKAFIETSDDLTLAAMLEDMLADLVASPADINDLGSLFKSGQALIDTDEGLAAFKGYVQNLKPTHPVVVRIQGFIVGANDNIIREVMDAMLSGVTYHAAVSNYSADAFDMLDLLDSIRTQLISQSGLQNLRNYVLKINTTTLIMQSLKNFILETSDIELTRSINELFKGTSFVPSVGEFPSVVELVRQLKVYVLSTKGLPNIRLYFQTLNPSVHSIITQIKEFIETADDIQIELFFKELFSPLD